jgi:methionyl aminopeptidase
MLGLRNRGIEVKTPAQLDAMRAAGIVVGQTLEMLAREVRPGVTTRQLDRIGEESIRAAGATPSFLGYHGFPASLCISVNDEVVHGIPGDRVVRDGDVVSVDCGAILDGWHGDAAVTVVVGEAPRATRDLLHVTEAAMWRGIAAAQANARVGDVSHAVERFVRQQGSYGIVEDYVGHGIGSEMHQPPNVPNVGRHGHGPRLVEGMAIAVEPMVVLGSAETRVCADDWTVVTVDGSLAAHFEHTVAVTSTGPWVLTALDGGAVQLGALGAPVGGC